MKSLWKCIGILTFAATGVFSADMFFKTPFTLWQDPEILVWTPDSAAPLDPKEFALSLKRNNSGIGNPTVRIAGEFERDTGASLYGNWLRNNLEPGIPAEDLKARDPKVRERIASIEDRFLLYVTRRGNTLAVALFDETGGAPKLAGTLPFREDKIQMGDEIAEMAFNGTPKRRLTADERKRKATEPDEYYSEIPRFHGWIGVAGGYTRAKVPLTPDSWYNSHLKSRIRNYRNTKDSLSAWNFLDDSSPLLNVYAGGLWYDFIGAELLFRFSAHDAKTDSRDTVYRELDHWTFYRYEIGISLLFSHRFRVKKDIDVLPHASLGFLYSFFSESIDTKSGRKPSNAYRTRVEFNDFYKGAIISAGVRGLFLEHYGIDIRAGIAGRGRLLDREPSVDAVAEPTEIGGSTIDCFIQLGLEYHWSL